VASDERRKDIDLKASYYKEGEREKRDFIPQNARDGAEFSLRRPTLSQERKRKKKSACFVRNDRGGVAVNARGLGGIAG
jgi:hypothetical protein